MIDTDYIEEGLFDTLDSSFPGQHSIGGICIEVAGEKTALAAPAVCPFDLVDTAYNSESFPYKDHLLPSEQVSLESAASWELRSDLTMGQDTDLLTLFLLHNEKHEWFETGVLPG